MVVPANAERYIVENVYWSRGELEEFGLKELDHAAT